MRHILYVLQHANEKRKLLNLKQCSAIKGGSLRTSVAVPVVERTGTLFLAE